MKVPTNVILPPNCDWPRKRPLHDCLWVARSLDRVNEGTAFALAERSVIGRGNHCDIRIHSDAVSHTHAVVIRSRDAYIIVDTDSTNGLLVNGKPLDRQASLGNGDLVQVRATVFEVVIGLGCSSRFVTRSDSL